MSRVSFKHVDSTSAGNIVGNTVVAVGKAAGKLGDLVDYVPVVGGFGSAALHFGAAAPIAAAGHLANFDAKGAKVAVVEHAARGAVDVGKELLPFGGALNWASGKVLDESIADKIVATTVKGAGGMPDVPPAQTPGRPKGKDNTPG